VPTWDELFKNPSLVAALPPEVQDDLYAQVAMLEARFRARVLARASSQKLGPESNDLVLIEEAATMLRTSKDSLHSKWSRLPFAFKDPLDGKIKFSRSRIERYIASRVGKGG
jgi:hypothetical protein